MSSTWSLQRRLTVAYATLLFVALAACAVIAVGLLEHLEQTQIQANLQRISRGVSALVVWRNGSLVNEIDPLKVARLNGTIAEAVVFDRHGNIVYTSSPDVPAVVRELTHRPISQEWAGPLGRAQNRWLAAVFPIVHEGSIRGQVVTWHSEAAAESLNGRIATSLAYFVPLLAIIALAFGIVIAREGLRPLYTVAEIVSDIEAHDLSRRVPAKGMPRELESLATAFNRMLDRLESSFNRERQFTADASHELRAPLTVIRATADYALENYRDGNEYRRALQTIGFEAQCLEGLIRDLLTAARAESQSVLSGHADLSAETFDVVEELYPMTRARGVTVNSVLPEEVRVALDPQSTRRLVRVLLDNAIRHAMKTVWVRVEQSRTDASLSVVDDGAGFSEEARLHATERFWRDDTAHQRGEGTGLGLAIALRIANAAGGTLDLRNNEHSGGEVRITLPLAED